MVFYLYFLQVLHTFCDVLFFHDAKIVFYIKDGTVKGGETTFVEGEMTFSRD